MNTVSDMNLTQEGGNNRRRELRLLIETLSLVTIFLFLSIILFSINSDTLTFYKNSSIDLNFTINNFHISYWVFGGFSAIMAIISLILMFWQSQARRIINYIENPKEHDLAFGVFWIILWAAIVITFTEGIVDTSSKLSNPTTRGIALIGGIILFLVAVIRIIVLGFRRTRN